MSSGVLPILNFLVAGISTKKFKMGSTPAYIRQYKAQLGSEWREEWAADEQPAHDVALDTYAIGKYTITCREFEQFVNDGGYTDKWEDCWSDGGWKWLLQSRQTAPDYWDDPRFHQPNYPVVRVTWY